MTSIADSSLVRTARALFALGKPRVTVMVSASALAGVAADRGVGARAWGTVLATTLLVCAANVLNCWLERDVDARMERTRGRPLPSGRIGAGAARAYGLVLAAVSLAALVAWAGALAAALGALALVLYVLAYTPLKRTSPLAIYVGAVPGALPPVIARVAVTGAVDLWCLVLFSMVYLWQIPHFVAIAIARRDDYARAGLRTLPLAWGEGAAFAHAAVCAVALVAVAGVPLALGAAGITYAALALAAACGLLLASWPPRALPSRAWARRLLLVSLATLPLLLVAPALDRVV